jgi:hypothetical protein
METLAELELVVHPAHRALRARSRKEWIVVRAIKLRLASSGMDCMPAIAGAMSRATAIERRDSNRVALYRVEWIIVCAPSYARIAHDG